MKFPFFLFMFLLINGCSSAVDVAVKSKSGDNNAAAMSPSEVNRVSYSVQPFDLKDGTTALALDGALDLKSETEAGVLQAKEPLVLPAEVPNELTLELSLAKAKELFSFRGEIKNENRVLREIKSAAFNRIEKNGFLEVHLHLTDLQKLFPADTQTNLEFNLLAFDDGGSIASKIKFSVSTPPKRLKKTFFFPVGNFEEKMKTTPTKEIRYFVSKRGTVLTLIGLVEIKNEERFSVEIEIPSKLAHTLEAVAEVSSLNQAECSYSIQKSFQNKVMSSNFELAALNPIDAKNPHRFRIPANDFGYIGVYAENLESFIPPQSIRTKQAATTRCWAHCKTGSEGDWADVGKWGEDCVACGREQYNMGQNCYSCMKTHRNWCRWEQWKTWADFEEVEVGTDFYFNLRPALLNGELQNPLKASFINQTVPARKATVLDEALVIKLQ